MSTLHKKMTDEEFSCFLEDNFDIQERPCTGVVGSMAHVSL